MILGLGLGVPFNSFLVTGGGVIPEGALQWLLGMKADNITLLDNLDIVNPEPEVREVAVADFASASSQTVIFPETAMSIQKYDVFEIDFYISFRSVYNNYYPISHRLDGENSGCFVFVNQAWFAFVLQGHDGTQIYIQENMSVFMSISTLYHVVISSDGSGTAAGITTSITGGNPIDSRSVIRDDLSDTPIDYTGSPLYLGAIFGRAHYLNGIMSNLKYSVDGTVEFEAPLEEQVGGNRYDRGAAALHSTGDTTTSSLRDNVPSTNHSDGFREEALGVDSELLNKRYVAVTQNFSGQDGHFLSTITDASKWTSGTFEGHVVHNFNSSNSLNSMIAIPYGGSNNSRFGKIWIDSTNKVHAYIGDGTNELTTVGTVPEDVYSKIEWSLTSSLFSIKINGAEETLVPTAYNAGTGTNPTGWAIAKDKDGGTSPLYARWAEVDLGAYGKYQMSHSTSIYEADLNRDGARLVVTPATEEFTSWVSRVYETADIAGLELETPLGDSAIFSTATFSDIHFDRVGQPVDLFESAGTLIRRHMPKAECCFVVGDIIVDYTTWYDGIYELFDTNYATHIGLYPRHMLYGNHDVDAYTDPKWLFEVPPYKEVKHGVTFLCLGSAPHWTGDVNILTAVDKTFLETELPLCETAVIYTHIDMLGLETWSVNDSNFKTICTTYEAKISAIVVGHEHQAHQMFTWGNIPVVFDGSMDAVTVGFTYGVNRMSFKKNGMVVREYLRPDTGALIIRDSFTLKTIPSAMADGTETTGHAPSSAYAEYASETTTLIPSNLLGTAAANGGAITNPGGKVHNRSECKLRQVAMAQKVLALNGDFAENIDGWGESDLVLSWDAGRLKGVRVKTSQTLLSTIGGAPTAATVYTVTFDLDYPEVNDSIQVSVGGGSLFGIDVTQGLASYSIDVTAGATAQTVKFNLDMSTGGSIVYFDNIVVKERDSVPAYDVFGAVANFYGDGSTTFDKKTYAQLDAHYLVNGDLNLWLEKIGNSFTRAVQYPMTQLFSQENALANIDDFGTGGTVLYDTGGLPQVDSNGYVIYTS